MGRIGRKRGRGRGLLPLALIVVVSSAMPTLAGDADERFLAALSRPGSVLDADRLMRLFATVGSELQAGQGRVGLLQQAMALRGPTAAATRERVARSFDSYRTSLRDYRAATLAAGAADRAATFRTLARGHRACWQLEGFKRLVETYGAKPTDLYSVLPSSQACQLFRAAAFHPRVERWIDEGLSSPTQLADEVRALRQELEAAEQLIEDLYEIDED